ncbi:MAG: flavodoxin domain-containing protein [Glycocaulis sp.]
MRRILMAYATTEGQTRKIAQAVADSVKRLGEEAVLVDLAAVPKALDPAEFDAVFVAASLHAGRYQSAARHFVKSNADKLAARPTAFISVSLSAAAGEHSDAESAEACTRKFLHEAGWTPKAIHQAAGALRFTQYDFFKRWIMKQIAKSQGHAASGDDVEFTDWQALETFVNHFLRADSPQAGHAKRSRRTATLARSHD